ncbi:MAG: UDP-2,3-diacylglucosamine diphosphatase, partial [Proteobacteria bacterium]|nr:UDP-2,3-diacylglucosamine diphosphatase [Pseudomonadota bacterium]
DLHLADSRPRLVEAFENLLATQTAEVRALYILGDLFESYIGDDDDAALNARVARATRKVRDAGVPVHFMHGNRDFLLGGDYAERAGMTLLADPAVIDLAGERTLLMHGDTLCTDDSAYLQFRARVRNPDWQRAFLAKPLTERRAFAAQARGESRKHTASARPEIMDVNQSAVEAALRTHGVRRLIHGHTHRPATHRFDMDGMKAERIVLGDWYEQASCLCVH